MDGRTGIPLVLLTGALLVLGVAWGAATQKEVFLGNQIDDSPSVSGDAIILTGFFVGAGLACGLLVIGQAPLRRRLTAAGVGGVSAWLLTFLVQSAWPNYVVIPEHSVASILLSNLLLESTGSPSVLLPVLALGILFMVGIGWAIRMTSARPSAAPTLSAIRRDHLAIAALAVPALVVTAAGMLRVMLELPAETAGSGLVTFLNPLAAAGCILLAVTIALRARHVARLRNDPDLAWPVMEAWRALDRIDLAGIGAITLVAALSTLLATDPVDVTSSGPTLLFTPRSHGQAILFLAVVLVPLHALQRRIGLLLPLARNDPIPASEAANRAVWAFVATIGAASILAFILTFLTGRALLPWVVALVPSAIVAGVIGRPRSAALVRIVAAWTLWGQGNTIQAFYQANTFPDLAFSVHPGILALWRMAAVAMVGWVVFDVMRDLSTDERPHVVIPLSLAAAVGVALLGLLELPLNVWAEATIPVNKVAIGSLLQSQQGGVQVVMHMLATVCGLGATMAAARLLRPDWFRRRRADPAPATQRATTPG